MAQLKYTPMTYN